MDAVIRVHFKGLAAPTRHAGGYLAPPIQGRCGGLRLSGPHDRGDTNDSALIRDAGGEAPEQDYRYAAACSSYSSA